MAAKRIISYSYTALRGSTAGATLLAGFLQTFVFARVFAPEWFSLFIFIAAVSNSLYIADAGISKVLFVNLRQRFLKNLPLSPISDHATVVVVLYFALAAVATAACFGILVGRAAYPVTDCAELSLFFLFNAINLPWLALRNISISIDEFFYFEGLEASRRSVTTVALLALLAGLPVLVFLLVLNVGWIPIIFAALRRLRRRQAFGGDVVGGVLHLAEFFRSNGGRFLSAAAHSISETYIYNFAYFLVPWAYGLGASTIIFDTANKIFRSNYMIYSAISDLFVPRQTRAFIEHDAPTLVRATLMAIATGAIPLICIAALLIFAHQRFFALLLGPSAVMPPEIVPVLVILLSVALVKLLAYSLLVHCGFFKQAARLGPIFVVAMTATSFLSIWLKLDIVGFMALNAASYTIGTIFVFITMIRGPIRVAAGAGDGAVSADTKLSYRA